MTAPITTDVPGSSLEVFRFDGLQSLRFDRFFVRHRDFPVISTNHRAYLRW